MPKKLDIVVNENIDKLNSLMNDTPNSLRIRIKMLILLKKGDYQYVNHLAKELKKERHTVKIWLEKYLKGGTKSLLKTHYKKNAQKVISDEIKHEIRKQFYNNRDIYIDSEIKYSYTKLLSSINEKFDTQLKYSTLYRAGRVIKSKIKPKYKTVNIDGEIFKFTEGKDRIKMLKEISLSNFPDF